MNAEPAAEMNNRFGSFGWRMRLYAFRRPLLAAVALVVLVVMPAAADPGASVATDPAHDTHAPAATASEHTGDTVVAVESKMVCMINDRSMANEQIPVPIDGRTYFGCCSMCKERLEKSEEARYAVDPVSGKKVDKATAFIGALPGAVVLYFEHEANFDRYNAGERAAK